VFFTWQTLLRLPSAQELHGQVDAFIVEIHAHPLFSFLLSDLLVIVVTVIFVRVLVGFNHAVDAILRTLKSDRRTYIKSFTIQKLEIFSAKQMKSFVLAAIRVARTVLVALLVLAYLLILFAIFPTTRGFVAAILSYLFKILEDVWLAIVGYIPSLLSLAVIIVITRLIIRVTDYLFQRLKDGNIKLKGFDPEWADTTFHLVRVLLIVMALVVAFPYLPGSDSPAFQGLSIFFGALLSLGSTSVVGNIMAGIVLTYTSAFNIGDRVKISETFGDVIEKTLLVTRIRTIKHVEITIPNSMVLASHIINYTEEASEKGLILNTTVTLGYSIPWRKVHEVLIAAALATEGVDPEPKPFVYQTALDDFYVHYEINAYTSQPEKMDDTYSFLHENIQDYCNEAGIEITSPHYAALRDGNAKAVPPEHLPKGYQAPPFHIQQEKE
jgi:small-conductance mechanosensitive channel